MKYELKLTSRCGPAQVYVVSGHGEEMDAEDGAGQVSPGSREIYYAYSLCLALLHNVL